MHLWKTLFSANGHRKRGLETEVKGFSKRSFALRYTIENVSAEVPPSSTTPPGKPGGRAFPSRRTRREAREQRLQQGAVAGQGQVNLPEARQQPATKQPATKQPVATQPTATQPPTTPSLVTQPTPTPPVKPLAKPVTSPEKPAAPEPALADLPNLNPAKTADPATQKKTQTEKEPAKPKLAVPLFHLRDQSKPTAATSAPKPPPGTLKANLIGIFSGLIIAPIALIFLIWGCKTMMGASFGGGVAPIILGLFEILAGTSLLSLTGVITGYYSSLSWAVSALWPVLLTVFAGPIRGMVASHNDTLTGISQYSFWWDFLTGVSTLTASGLFPTMAIVMVGASLASQIAYISGRDATMRERLAMETVDKQPGEPVVPRSRFRDHFLSIIVAILGTTGGMLALIPLHDRLAVITGAAGHISNLPPVAQYGLPILGIILLFIAVYAGSKSAAGLIVAGILCGIIPGIILTIGEVSTSGWAEHLVQFLSERLTASMHVSGGPLTAFGFVLVACGLTLYWCRQAGKRDQLADYAAAGLI